MDLEFSPFVYKHGLKLNSIFPQDCCLLPCSDTPAWTLLWSLPSHDSACLILCPGRPLWSQFINFGTKIECSGSVTCPLLLSSLSAELCHMAHTDSLGIATLSTRPLPPFSLHSPSTPHSPEASSSIWVFVHRANSKTFCLTHLRSLLLAHSNLPALSVS